MKICFAKLCTWVSGSSVTTITGIERYLILQKGWGNCNCHLISQESRGKQLVDWGFTRGKHFRNPKEKYNFAENIIFEIHCWYPYAFWNKPNHIWTKNISLKVWLILFAEKTSSFIVFFHCSLFWKIGINIFERKTIRSISMLAGSDLLRQYCLWSWRMHLVQQKPP